MSSFKIINIYRTHCKSLSLTLALGHLFVVTVAAAARETTANVNLQWRFFKFLLMQQQCSAVAMTFVPYTVSKTSHATNCPVLEKTHCRWPIPVRVVVVDWSNQQRSTHIFICSGGCPHDDDAMLLTDWTGRWAHLDINISISSGIAIEREQEDSRYRIKAHTLGKISKKIKCKNSYPWNP